MIPLGKLENTVQPIYNTKVSDVKCKLESHPNAI